MSVWSWMLQMRRTGEEWRGNQVKASAGFGRWLLLDSAREVSGCRRSSPWFVPIDVMERSRAYKAKALVKDTSILASLLQETGELIRTFSASIRTANQRRKS